MRYKIEKGLIAQRTTKRMTVFDSKNLTFFTFNETALYIFNCLKRGFDDKELVKRMMKRYQIDKIQAEKDLEEFIQLLKKEKIVSLKK
ncbi:hypothetical protein A2334_06010 [Candidatus Roizmanbacteria bacterium RIFOXYB2_FULL_38_10]|uniref:PqqD family protein n=1 Tax=Candidatus Roizmanbacteria bacterium RIFOXYD1_FULL_38_12 TaxID=1802093 RepID=A0A1F7L1S8_9BACT|nr:MAG: hypothetical protein A3K47_05010 [Candidatus Roizmanbacteria bacterium RIFOXYA2_FULL_38_14]OGK64109.1 MAG: hypothetical protein A3K27_05010 [Candidatus Roizmanbacteria bacterium RIFOXYA1_FULL_37_12]OGK65955.1 MAG: hypothetical protein A3K38_05010 [Candidatus Roizmanbacteria bacterium RIFOXYB1_FULL_40_23]OGK68403.1 MAG: hypothetical protein A2334_06010 [Candidatus Roizmanbacteria bacterium RIFOXYB2_FULL_38_10]OGK70360.1 MAG: hypothetical protein A3K21_05015 [Candidatus Roizmanbacteria ba